MYSSQWSLSDARIATMANIAIRGTTVSRPLSKQQARSEPTAGSFSLSTSRYAPESSKDSREFET